MSLQSSVTGLFKRHEAELQATKEAPASNCEAPLEEFFWRQLSLIAPQPHPIEKVPAG